VGGAAGLQEKTSLTQSRSRFFDLSRHLFMKVIVIGAGYAGVAAALSLAQQHEVTVVNERDYFIERIRLHERAAGRPLRKRPLKKLLRGARLVVGRARRIDTHTVTVGDDVLPYDELVLALGSRTDERLPGAREYATTLDGDVKLAKHIVILGGGLSGIEAAAELSSQAHVTLVTRTKVGAGFSDAARAHFKDRLKVDLVEDTEVLAIEPQRVVTRAGALTFDTCINAAGFVGAKVPIDLPLNERGQIIVDANLRAAPHIHVAGDLAAIEGPMGCKSAIPAGVFVGKHIADDAGFRYKHPGYCVSLGRTDGVIERPKRILTGRLAALVKETVCRSTLWSLSLL
jgi:NADH dehydrogenase